MLIYFTPSRYAQSYADIEMLTEENRLELVNKGYTVLENILSPELTDECIGLFDVWLKKFTDVGVWPNSENYLINGYKIGHSEAAWKVRLATKSVFSELWKTKHLLTSLEGISLGRPPETGHEPFYKSKDLDLLCSQSGARLGLHGVRGAVHLEPCNHDDWTFVVLSGSHKFLAEFYETHKEAMVTSLVEDELDLNYENYRWFRSKECKLKRIPVPKGGMLLWDSRTIFGSARPIKDRSHPFRQRLVVYVTMTPAMWADKTDIELKQRAYTDLLTTTHWSSQGISLATETLPTKHCFDAVKEIPDKAETEHVRELCGVIPYDNEIHVYPKPVWKPKWRGAFSNTEIHI